MVSHSSFVASEGLVGVEGGASVGFKDIARLDASISTFCVPMWTELADYGGDTYSDAQSFEVWLHFCINTYNASVTVNIASVSEEAMKHLSRAKTDAWLETKTKENRKVCKYRRGRSFIYIG